MTRCRRPRRWPAPRWEGINQGRLLVRSCSAGLVIPLCAPTIPRYMDVDSICGAYGGGGGGGCGAKAVHCRRCECRRNTIEVIFPPTPVSLKGDRRQGSLATLGEEHPRFSPPTPLIHPPVLPPNRLFYTLFMHQQHLQCRAALARRLGEGKGADEGRMDEGWETGAGQCSDAQLFGGRLIFLVQGAPPPLPRTCSVIRATHLAPPHPLLPPKSGEERQKLEEGCAPQLLIAIMISHNGARREDPLMTSSSSPSFFNFVLHTFSVSPPLGRPLPPFYFLPPHLVVLPLYFFLPWMPNLGRQPVRSDFDSKTPLIHPANLQ